MSACFPVLGNVKREKEVAAGATLTNPICIITTHVLAIERQVDKSTHMREAEIALSEFNSIPCENDYYHQCVSRG